MGEERLQGLEEVGVGGSRKTRILALEVDLDDRLGKDGAEFGLGAGVVLVYPLLECVDFPLQLCVTNRKAAIDQPTVR